MWRPDSSAVRSTVFHVWTERNRLVCRTPYPDRTSGLLDYFFQYRAVLGASTRGARHQRSHDDDVTQEAP
jgi:hypothetical protein